MAAIDGSIGGVSTASATFEVSFWIGAIGVVAQR
jgi:hypothetical protein